MTFSSKAMCADSDFERLTDELLALRARLRVGQPVQ